MQAILRPVQGGDGRFVARSPGPVTVRSLRGSTTVAWCAVSHAGNVRQLNEDSVLAVPPAFVVADGMGGHDGGEVASALAVEVLSGLTSLGHVGSSDVRTSVQQANRAIFDRSSHGDRGMGTTVTGLVIGAGGRGADAAVLNVGDSRTYRRRDGEFVQLTRDHSHVQELVDSGVLSPAEAPHHPERNVVTRALGIDPTVDVDLRSTVLLAGDRYLVCSDGLSSELSEGVIADLLARGHEPSEAAEALVGAVLGGAALDNVSVIVVDIVEVVEDDDPDRTNPRVRAAVSPAEQITVPRPPASEAPPQDDVESAAGLIAQVPAGAAHLAEAGHRDEPDDLLIDGVPGPRLGAGDGIDSREDFGG